MGGAVGFSAAGFCGFVKGALALLAGVGAGAGVAAALGFAGRLLARGAAATVEVTDNPIDRLSSSDSSDCEGATIFAGDT